MKPILLMLSLMCLALPSQATERCPPPESTNVPDNDSNAGGVIVGVVLACIVIEAATDGTCLFWRWDVWKPKAQPVNASSVPESPVNEYLRIRHR